jgi:hypothetical protein
MDAFWNTDFGASRTIDEIQPDDAALRFFREGVASVREAAR